MNKYEIYEQEKQVFLFLNNPTAEEFENYCKQLAKKLGI